MGFLASLKRNKKVYIFLLSFITIIIAYNEGMQFLEKTEYLSFVGWLEMVVLFVVAVNLGIRLHVWEEA